jgi:hypothetical protein
LLLYRTAVNVAFAVDLTQSEQAVDVEHVQQSVFINAYGLLDKHFNHYTTKTHSLFLHVFLFSVVVKKRLSINRMLVVLLIKLLMLRYVNDVELAIKSIGEPLRDFNATNSYAAFGFGAKIPPHFRESQEFCLVSLVNFMSF